VKNVAGLEHLQDFAVLCVVSFRTVHSLMQVRIEILAERLDPFHTEAFHGLCRWLAGWVLTRTSTRHAAKQGAE